MDFWQPIQDPGVRQRQIQLALPWKERHTGEHWLVGFFFGWLVGWLVDWLIGWLIGWLVGWLVGWSVGWLIPVSIAGRSSGGSCPNIVNSFRKVVIL